MPGLGSPRLFERIRLHVLLLKHVRTFFFPLFPILTAEHGQLQMAALTFRPPHTTAADPHDPHFIVSSFDFLNRA